MADINDIREMGPNGRLALDAWLEVRSRLKEAEKLLDEVLGRAYSDQSNDLYDRISTFLGTTDRETPAP